MHPEHIVDAHVILTKDNSLESWKSQAGDVLGGRSGGVVLLANGDQSEVKAIAEGLESTNVLSVAIPFDLDAPDGASQYGSLQTKAQKSLHSVVKSLSPDSNTGLKWALQQGCPVDLDVQTPMAESSIESFQELIISASDNLQNSGPIILSNVLPPPHDLTLPIVKLLNDPMYRSFQAFTASLSLYPRIFVKFTPPSWDAPTPSTSASADLHDKQKREWKRRIKMFLGPVIEAFGVQRIIFGSSPSPAATGSSTASDWYEIARESLAELGVEQEDIDAVFFENAKRVYAAAPSV